MMNVTTSSREEIENKLIEMAIDNECTGFSYLNFCRTNPSMNTGMALRCLLQLCTDKLLSQKENLYFPAERVSPEVPSLPEMKVLSPLIREEDSIEKAEKQTVIIEEKETQMNETVNNNLDNITYYDSGRIAVQYSVYDYLSQNKGIWFSCRDLIRSMKLKGHSTAVHVALHRLHLKGQLEKKNVDDDYTSGMIYNYMMPSKEHEEKEIEETSPTEVTKSPRSGIQNAIYEILSTSGKVLFIRDIRKLLPKGMHKESVNSSLTTMISSQKFGIRREFFYDNHTGKRIYGYQLHSFNGWGDRPKTKVKREVVKLLLERLDKNICSARFAILQILKEATEPLSAREIIKLLNTVNGSTITGTLATLSNEHPMIKRTKAHCSFSDKLVYFYEYASLHEEEEEDEEDEDEDEKEQVYLEEHDHTDMDNLSKHKALIHEENDEEDDNDEHVEESINENSQSFDELFKEVVQLRARLDQEKRNKMNQLNEEKAKLEKEIQQLSENFS